MTNGWDESAAAWIADMGARGDYGREFVLDRPMIGRVKDRGFRQALDVGCGEGRFCRMLNEVGIRTVGIDPTRTLIRHARQQDPEGEYRLGVAEALDFADRSFDLVVSYLTLINIPDLRAAIAEMNRVLQPGGTLLIANLTSFMTAGPPAGWARDKNGEARFHIDHYGGASGVGHLARYPHPRLASAAQHLHVTAAGAGTAAAALFRAYAGRGRSRKGRVAPARAVLFTDGVAEA
jgi:SAM-dependent methyltransferase